MLLAAIHSTSYPCVPGRRKHHSSDARQSVANSRGTGPQLASSLLLTMTSENTEPPRLLTQESARQGRVQGPRRLTAPQRVWD